MRRQSLLKLLSTFFIAVILLQFLAAPGVNAQKYYKQLTYPPLKNLKIPKPKMVTLKNGMRLMLIEDHDFPFINISARIKVGDIYDPATEDGLASITATVMRTGGTAAVPGDTLDEKLEDIAASIETWMGTDMGGANMNTIKDHFDEVLNLFADVLMHPAFPQEKIDLAKVSMRSAISRRNDDANQIVDREFQRLIYGKDSPYARNIEYADVDAIKRDDMVAFYKKYYHPNGIIMGIWGDFKTGDMIKKIRAAFRGWKPAQVQYPKTPAVNYQFVKTVNLVEKSDINQSKIRIGHIGGRLDDPDYPALVMMNQILSGGFASRLFTRVRSNQGLAYDVRGRYGADFIYPGVFYMGVSTKSETTVKSIRSLLKELKEITEKPVGTQELKLAKDSYLNSYVFKFDSKGKIINRLLTYAYYGYSLDFMDKMKKAIEAVTVDDIYRVARKHLHPDAVQILVVGKSADFDQPLSVLGKVNKIDITIPVPQTEAAPAATSKSLAEGREALLKMAKALGGLDKIKKIHNYVEDLTQNQVTPMGEMSIETKVTMVYPEKLHISMQTPGGEIKMVMAGDKSWMATPRGTMPAPPAVRKNLKESSVRDWVYILQHLDGAKAQLVGETTFEKTPALDVLVTLDNVKFHAFLKKDDYLPLGIQYSTVGRQGPMTVKEVYSDWRDVDHVKVSFKAVSSAKGKKLSEATVKSFRYNAAVDETLFKQ